MAKLGAHSSSFALGFLRRLLCAHTSGAAGGDTAQQHPGGGVGDAAAAAAPEDEEGAEARSPCIVARLMGLDAMPTPARDSPRQLRRSRSASSAEGRSPPPPCRFEDGPRPRMVRTTSSFRDKPAYLRAENDEFLLLSFSPEDEDDDHKAAEGFFKLASGRDDDDGDGRKKQRRGRRRISRRRRLCGDEEAEAEAGPGRSSRRPAAAAAAGLQQQNSSPVSVLEARDGQEEESTTTMTTTSSSSSSIDEVEPAEEPWWSPTSGENWLAQREHQGLRRKLLQPHSEELSGGLPHAPAVPRTSYVSNCSDGERRDMRLLNKVEVIAPDATSIWRNISRLLEKDICGMKWEGRDDGDIAAEMEQEILDQLICEETDELMQLIMV